MFILFVFIMLLTLKITVSETTRNTAGAENMSVKIDSKESATTAPWDGISNPQDRSRDLSPALADDNKTENSRRLTFWPNSAVTRLAKSISLGLRPSFNKQYFEPFERRQKPVTVIGIRKNGLFSRTNVNMLEKSSESAAELQSPYNEISSFWVDEKH